MRVRARERERESRREKEREKETCIVMSNVFDHKNLLSTQSVIESERDRERERERELPPAVPSGHPSRVQLRKTVAQATTGEKE